MPKKEEDKRLSIATKQIFKVTKVYRDKILIKDFLVATDSKPEAP